MLIIIIIKFSCHIQSVLIIQDNLQRALWKFNIVTLLTVVVGFSNLEKENDRIIEIWGSMAIF
jgi:hypothetical protein